MVIKIMLNLTKLELFDCSKEKKEAKEAGPSAWLWWQETDTEVEYESGKTRASWDSLQEQKEKTEKETKKGSTSAEVTSINICVCITKERVSDVYPWIVSVLS